LKPTEENLRHNVISHNITTTDICIYEDRTTTTMAYRAIATRNTLMIMKRRTKTTGSLNLNIHTVRESHQTLALKPLKPTLKPTLNLLTPLQVGTIKELLSYPQPQAVIVNTNNTTTQAVIENVNTVNTTTGVESNPPRGYHHVRTEQKLIFDMSIHRNDDESMENVEDWKPKAEEEDASMEDAEANMDLELLPLDDVAVSDSDSIDEFIDNESSDSDLYSVVKESSVIEMVDHHSCDKLIGTIVTVDDLAEVSSSGIVVNDHCNDDESMENVEDWKPEAEEEDVSMEDAEANMDWEPLPLRRSPRLAALRESSSLRPLRRSQRLAALYNGR
jgi:hypothetical protein